MKSKLNRRDFLKKGTTTVLGAGLALKTGISLSAETQEQSRVVEIKHPKALFTPQTLWLGTDPVALDTVGFQVIDAKRKERGLPALAESGRPIDHIELAGKKGIGISDLNRIKLDKITLS